MIIAIRVGPMRTFVILVVSNEEVEPKRERKMTTTIWTFVIVIPFRNQQATKNCDRVGERAVFSTSRFQQQQKEEEEEEEVVAVVLVLDLLKYCASTT